MNILSVQDVANDKLLLRLFKDAEILREEQFPPSLLGKPLMGTLFLEPSLRTRLSFEAAMLRLNGKVVSCADATCTSMAKGETLNDTIGTLSQYVDLLVVRTKEDVFDWGNLDGGCPIINAGDGANGHPTQALTDAYTIWRKFKTIDNLNIGIVGDLSHSRTIGSLVQLLGKRNKMWLIDSTDDQAPLGYNLTKHLGNYCFPLVSRIKECIGELDVLYLNRVQRERHVANWAAPISLFSLDREKLNLMKDNSIIMNPGPRREEQPQYFDPDPRVVFFDQAKNGMYVRMALISMIWNRDYSAYIEHEQVQGLV